MWIYWKEQCEYCKTECSYIMRDNVAQFIKDLSKIEKKTEFIYGSLKWNCDYFKLDEEKYLKENPGDSCC